MLRNAYAAVGMRTGMPVDVRIVATSVAEKSKLEDALAEANLASTRLGSASESSSSIVNGMWRCGGQELGEEQWRLRKAGAQTLDTLQTSYHQRPIFYPMHCKIFTSNTLPCVKHLENEEKGHPTFEHSLSQRTRYMPENACNNPQ